ncbi:MAG: hypothetical protein V1707_01900 [bacterium]
MKKIIAFLLAFPSLVLAQTQDKAVRLYNPIPAPDNGLIGIIGNANKAIFGAIGVVALALFIYAGILMLTAGGNEKKIQEAKDTMLWAGIGLFIIFASYGLIRFIAAAITTGSF